MRFSRTLHRTISISRLILARLRTVACRWRGATIGSKCRFGAGVRVDRPWCCVLEERTTLEDSVWLKIEGDSAQVTIGSYCFLGRGSEIDSTIGIRIGHHVLIGPNVFITDHNHNTTRSALVSEQGCSGGTVTIQDDVWIGTQAVILPKVTVHQGAVVAAGAIVNRDVPRYEIWGGVPAKKIGERKT